MPYRLIYVGLALIGIAAIALGIVLSPVGEEIELPGPVETVSPSPGSQVPGQAILEIDLEVGYEAEIVVDGWPINDATFVQGTGVYRWSPHPNHPTITEWTPGEHTVRITWDTYTGLPDTGSFEWTFRVG
jgi:hypothetical protein